MNRSEFIGRLTRDAEIKVLQNGTPVAKFSIAVTRPFKKDVTDYFNCVIFGKNAENFTKFTGKGKRVWVEGYLSTGSYENKDGFTVRTVDLNVQNFEIIDWPDKKDDKSSGDDFNGDFSYGDDFDASTEDGRIPF